MNKLNNKSFWNNRYETNMTLGSGTGSRGNNLKLKEDLVRNILKEYSVESVLDIGCGDCEVNKNIDMPNYIGLDVSDVIVKRNSELYPNRNYIMGDFNYIKNKEIKSDLVICFDVLIHQPTIEEYNLGIQTIKDSFNKVALVSGFEKAETKGIIYFYENIIKSFTEENYNVEILHKFDLQTIIKITKK
jgi:hypothetical protein